MADGWALTRADLTHLLVKGEEFCILTNVVDLVVVMGGEEEEAPITTSYLA